MIRNLSSSLLLVFLLAGPAIAQEEATAFNISLANPGARSLGFGGAFVALADDATATFANPAGLIQMLEPELTLELRGQQVLREDAADRGFTTLGGNETSGQAFLAFVYPFKQGAIAIYRNGFGNLTFGNRIAGNSGNRAFNISLTNQFEIDTVGLSASYRLSEDLSVGFGVAQWDTLLTSSRDSTLNIDGFAEPSERRLTTLTTTDERDISFNVGFLWRFADQWRLGGVYRGGPEVSLRSERRVGPPPIEQQPVAIRQFPFLLPDVFGLGVAYKSRGGNLTLSFEWDLVRYSRLLDSLPNPDRGNFELDDGHELHFGLEYAIFRSRPVIALRFGAWQEPERQLRYFGSDPIERATFRGGDNELHTSVGVGFAFKSLKLDFAYDAADLIRTGSFTLIYSF